MRKSYENHLKSLGLTGKNKSIKHEEAVAAGADKMVSLRELSAWPAEEWHNQKVNGKDVKKGLPDSMKATLEKAFSLNPGSVPEGSKWEDIVGLDKPNPYLIPSADTTKPRKDPKVNGKAAAGATRESAGATEHIRARRNANKRSYDDRSFEGYGEGFLDDEMDGNGYESGDTYTSKNIRGIMG